MERLYFIAIVPPAKIQDEITQLKHLVAERFNSKHALRSPPHITLHMPFKWKDQKLEKLIEAMKLINLGLVPFDIELKRFNFFEPRVVYVDVIQNEMLGQLQEKVVSVCRKELKLNNADYKNRGFHPHVTIGFRDLRKPKFYEAKDYFEEKEFTIQFKAESVKLLKHDGHKWSIFHYSS